MKKIIKWVVIGIVVLSVIGSLSSKDTPQKVETSQSSQVTETKKVTEVYKVGDTIALGDVELTVNKIEESNGSQFMKPQEGNKWVELNLTIKNNGNKQEYITTLGQMFILDGENNQYQVTVTSKRMQNPGSTGLDGALIASAKKTDWVGFEVPKNATGLKFQYNTSFIGSKSILVSLDK